MRVHLVVLASAFFGLAVYETAVAVIAAGSGGGPVTETVGRALWRLALTLNRRLRTNRGLQAIGVAIVMVTPLLWVASLLAGWTLLFNAADGAVVHTATGVPADAVGRLYFAGYTAFGMGNGDFSPSGSGWQVATVLANLSGLVTVTLSVTYLVPVVQAAAHRRRLARTIASLGGTPGGILERAWDGERLSGLAPFATDLLGEIHLVAEHHLAYPVLHYFHAIDPQASFTPRLAALHEAVLVALSGLPPDRLVEPATLQALDEGIHAFVDTLPAHMTGEAGTAPRPIDTDGLLARGLPVDVDAVRAACEQRRDTRRRLASIVEYDGWSWEAAVLPSDHAVHRRNHARA